MLNNVITTEDNLISFLEVHRDSLNSLTLHGVKLRCIHEASDPSRRPSRQSSVVRTIWPVGQVTRLRRVKLWGSFSHGHNQDWGIDTGRSRECFVKEVVDYICQRGPFPFSGLEHVAEADMERALSNDLRDREWLGEWIEHWHRELRPHFDYSWQNCMLTDV